MRKEIERIANKYPRPDSKELFKSELEYLVEQTISKVGKKEGWEENTDYHIKRLLED